MKLRTRLPKIPHVDAHHTFVRVQTAGHMSYFLMVFLEAHGTYGLAAGALFILNIIGMFMHEEVA